MKKTLRDLSVLVGLALLGIILATLWQKFGTSTSFQRSVSEQLSKPSPQQTATALDFKGAPNRQALAHQAPDQLPEVPVQPSDDHIVGSRIFADRLWPVDGESGAATLSADNAALGEFLRLVAKMTEKEKFAALEDWLKSNGSSRWALALKNELMGFKHKTGWFDVARQGWDEIWKKTKDRTDLPAYHLANGALGSLLDTNIGISRAAKLRELVAAADARPLNGALEGKVFRAREAVWLLDHTAAQNVMCGPLALNAIKEFKREPFIAPRLSQVPPDYQQTGIPLSEVQRYAQNDYHLELAIAHRSDSSAKIPTPAVMHVKDDHFNALLAASADGSKYFLEDRTQGFAGWVDKAAVDQAASGFFLVAAVNLGSGWDKVDAVTGSTVFGRDGAHGTTPTDETTTKDTPSTEDKDPCKEKAKGMPRYTFLPMPGAIRISDVPVSYSPPVGPSVAFEVNYNDMDSGAPTSPPTWSHVGVTWSTNWVAWVEHVSGSLTNGTNLRVRVPGGGTELVLYSTASAKFGPHDRSFATVTRSGTFTYTREMPDGSIEIYNAPNHPTSPTKVFLSQIIDPQGNALTLAYDASIRLVSLTDAIGQVTTLSYDDVGNIYRITRVTDPFGRFATLTYDVGGRLTGITDQLGLASSFTYAVSGFIGAMTTPYGTSTFNKLVDSVGSNRVVEATDPLGGKERVEFNDTGSSFIPSLRSPPKSVTVGGQSVSFYAEDSRLQFRNGWYWDKLASEVAPGDYKAARNYRFYTNVNWQVVPVIETVKPALEDRIWFNYPGGVGVDGSGFPYFPGASSAPEKTLRILADGTPQLIQTYSNALGNLIKIVDPLGRTTEYLYAANLVDLLEVRQTTGGVNERQLAITYNSQHQPVTVTDAAGQVTSYSYNARGQVLTATDPAGGTATFTYDINGYVTSIDGPLPGVSDVTTFSYDSVGRVSTITHPDGYARTFTYDSFDRLTSTNFPDGTFEQISYNKLDRATFTDRLGRVTSYSHNAVQQLVQLNDPLARIIKLSWCHCGSISSLTDPLGRITRWKRDVEGRVTAKIAPDGSQTAYEYDDGTGRLIRRKDEKGQQKLYKYNIDDTIRQLAYQNSLVATPAVSFTYDPVYKRVASMKDGIGTTQYAYNSITGGSSPGAGLLSAVDGPFPNDTVTYAYDILGRVTTLGVNGVNSTLVFDEMGRGTSLTDPLGTHTLTYDGPTSRPATIVRPNGVTSSFTYLGNTQDHRLQRLKHTRTDNSVISQFDYTYDAIGRVLNWVQAADGAEVSTWALSYDAVDQLTAVVATKGGNPAPGYAYSYDAGANRLTQTVGATTGTFGYNLLNQLVDASIPLPAITYEWDAEDRVTAMVSGISRTELAYDGVGRCRIIRELKSGKLVSTQTFVWDNFRRVEERNADGTAVVKRYLAQGLQVLSGAQAGLYYYTRDHLGSVREVLSSTAQLQQRLSYDPWGGTTASNSSLFGTEFGFTNHFRHGPTGNYLAPFRAYSPAQGRWISRDPIGETDHFNRYAYVSNNPVSSIDPMGLYGKVTVDGNKVTITLPIEYEGPGVSDAQRQAFKEGIEKYWTGKFGKYEVTAVVVTPTADCPQNKKNVIQVPEGNGRPFVNGVGGNTGTWPAGGQVGTPGWEAAHESGHLLGLDDRYTDDGGAHAGYEHNIMGAFGQPVGEADITAIINANK